MMEQRAQTERVKKKGGRPRGTGLCTDEENKERARQRAILYYSSNFEKRKKTIRLPSNTKYCLKMFYCFLIFIYFHLNN